MSRWYLLSLLILLSANTMAHDSRPLYIEINEVRTDHYQLQWQAPGSIPVFNLPEISMPAGCEQTTEAVGIDMEDGFLRRGIYHCPTPLTGQALAFHYPLFNPSLSTLIRINLLSGTKYLSVLSPDQTTWRVPEAETVFSVARGYTALGIRHILEGIDHLLFLICLLFIAATPRRILVTITGFTAAHSLTLFLSALNIIRLPVAPIEAVIALSIVFLAVEIAKGKRDTLTWKYPITVSSSFGLLHGLGFAIVLGDIGLPQTEKFTGLLFFNVGVEVVQLMFIAVVFLIVGLFKRYGLNAFYLPAKNIGVYVVGTLASFWVVERCFMFFP